MRCFLWLPVVRSLARAFSLEAFDVQVTKLQAATLGDCPTIDEVKQALQKDTYKIVTLTHVRTAPCFCMWLIPIPMTMSLPSLGRQVDTSTGVLTDVKSFAKAVREVSPQSLVVVDGVCATGPCESPRSLWRKRRSHMLLRLVETGAEELRMDEWGVDVCLTASQKAIGVPPGLAILLASPRAMVRKHLPYHQMMICCCFFCGPASALVLRALLSVPVSRRRCLPTRRRDPWDTSWIGTGGCPS